MNDQPLLAKSPPLGGDDSNAHLISHLKYTYWAAKAILENTGESVLKAIGVDSSQIDRFRRIYLLAAAAHDLGKANSLFQEVVRGAKGRQSVRHEWLLYILLRRSPLGTWFRTAFEHDVDFTYFLWAIVGHHRKNSEEAIGSSSEMTLLFNASEFKKVLHWIATEFNLESPDRLLPEESSASEPLWSQLKEKLKKHGESIADLLWQTTNTDSDFAEDKYALYEQNEKSFMAVIRSFLMAADVPPRPWPTPIFPPGNLRSTKR